MQAQCSHYLWATDISRSQAVFGVVGLEQGQIGENEGVWESPVRILEKTKACCD